jgi:DNA-binding SARP family transcriptional activator
MNNLDIRLFGGVQVFLNGQGVGPFPTRWASGLLAYLALKNGKLLHRDVLAALFWPEEPDQRARKSLRNALWRLRSLIEPPGIPQGAFLTVTGQSVGLTGTGSIRLDVADFDRLVSTVADGELDDDRLGCLEECLQLYRGDFMDGHDYRWCVHERERLRLGLLMVLERLLAFHLQREEWSFALQRGMALLRHDPFREHVHRCLMVCHYSMGDRPLAIRQYHECERMLKEEMGLTPMEATKRLFWEIQRDSGRLDDPDAVRLFLSSCRIEQRMTEALARAEEALADLRRLAEGARNPDGSEEYPWGSHH